MLKYRDIEALIQCEKRLYLEVNTPKLNTPETAHFSVDVFTLHKWKSLQQATRLVFDKGNKSDASQKPSSQEQTIADLLQGKPLFQAKFVQDNVAVVVDALIPIKGKPRTYKMLCVIAATEVSDEHIARAAFNYHVAKHECEAQSIKIAKVVIAYINMEFVYAGDKDYKGLFSLKDITKNCILLEQENNALINQAKSMLNLSEAPNIACGEQCQEPLCPFLNQCAPELPQAKAPVSWLPNLSKRGKIWDYIKDNALNELSDYFRDSDTYEMKDAPDELLNEIQRRVKHHTLENTLYFDSKGAKAALSEYPLPLLFLDFETANFVVPLNEDLSPYMQVPFQFSLHKLDEKGELEHFEFLDVSGDNPMLNCAKELIRLCKGNAAIFAHNAIFERTVINWLAHTHPKLAKKLLAIKERIVDLLPIARDYYYHPAQKGSWSIKALLPTIAPDLDYASLTGVQNGGMAMSAYAECLNDETTDERKEAIKQELLAYCHLDTLALVHLWAYLSGNSQMIEPSKKLILPKH